MTTGTSTRIRPFALSDREAVVRMLGESDPWKRLGYGAADWERLFAAPTQGRDGYVIETEGTVAGLALLRPRFLFGDYLELLAVAPGRQGRGLGGALLGHVEEQTFARGQNLFVCVSDFNEGARRFYRRHGYVEVGPIPNLLIPGTTEILMRKSVGPARE